MTDKQIELIDAALRMIQEKDNFQPNTLDPSVRAEITNHYAQAERMSISSLARDILVDAIASRGYFSR